MVVLAPVREGDGAGDLRRVRPAQSAPGGDALLEVRHLVQEFVLRDYGGAKGGVLQAVADVSFDLHAGETLGIVGETGSGKSTLARSVIQAPPPKRGEVIFQGKNLVGLSHRAMKPVRRDLQMVFQDPFTSLDPEVDGLADRRRAAGRLRDRLTRPSAASG